MMFLDMLGSIMQIAEDNTGKLWLATPGELMRFNPVSNTYDYFKNDFLNKNSISYNSISSLFIDRQVFYGLVQREWELIFMIPKQIGFRHFL